MGSIILKYLALLVLAPLFSGVFVSAAAAEPPTKTDIVLVDQMVASSFVPESSFLLYVHEGLGVRKVPATFVDQGPGEHSAKERKLLLGSATPIVLTGEAPLFFTFFLKGSASTFAATPIRSWATPVLRENIHDPTSVGEDVSDLRARKEQLSSTLKEVELALRALRKQASQIAGVDEIIDLKLELARVKGFGEQGGPEQERLAQLIQIGRTRKDSPQIDQQRLNLTLQLQDTAQKTAMALRLQARRKAAAHQAFERKLSLVRQMSRYDPTVLAQDIVRLRKQNADLRAEIGDSMPPPEDQF